jgi:hypothetical protein
VRALLGRNREVGLGAEGSDLGEAELAPTDDDPEVARAEELRRAAWRHRTTLPRGRKLDKLGCSSEPAGLAAGR